MIEIAISCDMSQTFAQRMNSDPKPKRERFQQLTQSPKVKTGKVFAADLRKSQIHPTVKKLTAWRKLNRLSQRKAVAVLVNHRRSLFDPLEKHTLRLLDRLQFCVWRESQPLPERFWDHNPPRFIDLKFNTIQNTMAICRNP